MTRTSVYGVSVDSRSRNLNEADNNYTVQLQRMLDRVKSIQLGSFQFQDARYAFENHVLTFSEPITIPFDAFLRFTETTNVVNKLTGAVHQTSRTLSLVVPPTMNQITALDDVSQLCTTVHNHGLMFGVNHYPLVGLRLQLVGGDFPQDLQQLITPSFPKDSPRPVLTSATTQSLVPSSTSFFWKPGYLDELTSSVGVASRRVVDGSDYHSYIYAPPPTLVELFTMLNAAVGEMTRRSDLSGMILGVTNTSPVTITTTTAHGLATGDQVVVSGVEGNGAANGIYFITTMTPDTFQLDDTISSGTYTGGGTWLSPQTMHVPVTFGFNHGDETVVISARNRTTETATTRMTVSTEIHGPLATLLGVHGTRLESAVIADVSTLLRRVPLKSGNFTAAEVAQHTMNRMNVGDLSTFDATERTLFCILPSGVRLAVVLEFGCYSMAQLATSLALRLQDAPAHINVTYDAVAGTLTFTHVYGHAFALDFTTSGVLVAEHLGFERRLYANAATYTSSPRPRQPPRNQYVVTTDEITKHYTFSTREPMMFAATDGSSTAGVGAVWNPVIEARPFAHAFQPGDLVLARRPTLSGTQTSVKQIIDVSATTPIAVTTANAHGLVDGDNVTVELVEGNTAANGTWFIANATSTTFELVGSRGDGVYVGGTGQWWTNVSSVAGVPRSSAVFELIVAAVWDASGVPTIRFQPTASIFAAEDVGVPHRRVLGTPAATDGLILMTSGFRNVFMLHLHHPAGSPATFGFPSMAWPPSQYAVAGTVPDLARFPAYNPSTRCVAVASSYTSPFAWNLDAPDYILVSIHLQQSTFDLHTHSYRGSTMPIFAKLLINNPYVNISEELHFSTFASNGRFNQLNICFFNPDGTLVNFNGRSHSFTLLFTLHEDAAVLPCI